MNPGEILDNRYEIVKRLGAGGMGEVYMATHTHLGAPRVIKVVHPQISGNVDAQDRFLREARAATKVHHPNVATLHDFSTLPDGSHYMVWEYIDGENLAQKLRARGTLPARQAVRLVIQALHGLEAIHRAGIVHRDISPENLMITHEDERVKIIDLGVAKIEDSNVSQTRTGIFVGKLRYAAPEQLGFLPDGQRIDARADIYSVAMVLVELLTGRPPYEAKSPHEYFILHANPAPAKTVELPAEMPGSTALQAVLEKALARDRNQRFGSAREFATALEEIERTLPEPRDMPTMAVPLDGDATMRVTPAGQTKPDTLHRPTVVSDAGAPAAAAPATVLTPVPEAAFPQHAPTQGSIGPLLVIGLIVLLAAGGIALALFWPFGEKKLPPSGQTTASAPPPVTTTTAAPADTPRASETPKASEASVTVTESIAPVPTTTTVAPVVVETTTTATAPVLSAPIAKPKPKPVEVVEKPKPQPQPAPTEPAEEETPPQSSASVPTYVDGGEDSDANERALEQLRRQVRGTKTVALRAGAMQVEVARALREYFPNLDFAPYADVVIRFDGRMERLGRGRKRRGAVATVSKNGRVIFRYELPDEVYRVGMAPPDAFARVLADAMSE